MRVFGKRWTLGWLSGLLCVTVLTGGCGGNKVVVRGTVTVDGRPIEEGAISFEPADGQGTTTGGPITDGRYELTGSAAVTPGKQLVRIVGLRKTGKMVEAGPPAPRGTLVEEVVQCVPGHYNDQSRLQVEIRAAQANTHDFDLDSKPLRPGARSP